MMRSKENGRILSAFLVKHVILTYQLLAHRSALIIFVWQETISRGTLNDSVMEAILEVRIKNYILNCLMKYNIVKVF